MSLGRFLKYARTKADLTQRDVERLTGINYKTLSNWENDVSNPSPPDLMALSGAYHVSIDSLVGNKNQSMSVDPQSRGHRIPVLGSIAAGIPIEAIEDVIDWEEIPADWLRGGAEYFALKIKGGSMEPRMFDGDVVIVRKQPTVETGQIAAVLINGEEATVKKLTISPEGVMLIGLNPSVYEPRFYSNAEVQSLPLTVLGLVVEVRGKLA